MGDAPGQEAAGTASDLEYEVVGGARKTAHLMPGDIWTFGRSNECTETLTLPALSRVALILQHLDQGTLRVMSRQSNTGRVLLAADDASESHVLARGSSPVPLSRGNFTLKVELPPVVLRMQLAVPGARQLRDPPSTPRHGAGVNEVTRHSWVPEPGEPEEDAWITVAALAVVTSRYPEIAGPAGEAARHSRRSSALRTAVAAWCGRSSAYWINERLKEAADAADLDLPERGERLSAVVAHYELFFPDATIRATRDELSRLVHDASKAP